MSALADARAKLQTAVDNHDKLLISANTAHVAVQEALAGLDAEIARVPTVADVKAMIEKLVP